MIKKLLTGSKELTDAMKERGFKQMLRVITIIDVLYALMLYRLFTLMPSPEADGITRENISEIISTSYLNYLAILVGIILILLYWGQSNLQYGNMDRTDGRHAVLSILQVFFLMLYLYYVRLDLEFDGPELVLALESITLALAGFFSVWGWYHAVQNGMVSENLTTLEIDQTYLKLMPEPVTAVFTIPFAVFGPGIWSLSWLLLIPVSWILKRIRNRMKSKQE
jgi:hypothetical protein